MLCIAEFSVQKLSLFPPKDTMLCLSELKTERKTEKKQL